MKCRNRSSMLMGGKVRSGCIRVFCVISLMITVSFTRADLGPENVLILVNADSATSRYIAKMYREYYPAITDVQVLALSGLPDCSGPASTAAEEIITRDVYDARIAEPVRQHLLNHNLIQQIMVIVTTAGMPYRIEDTTYSDVIYPAGSNYLRVSQNVGQINAASVESELTCLWYADAFGLANRMVNPYQGYRNSSITLFERLAPGSKPFMWNSAVTSASEVAPRMEGKLLISWPPSYGTVDRLFHAGDMYLTCRLDGPKMQGQSAVFSVRKMLERSRRASDPSCGVDASSSVIVIDDSPSKTYDFNRIFNLDGSINYYSYDPDTKQPPDAPTVLTMDDYTSAFDAMTSGLSIASGEITFGRFDAAYGMAVLLDERTAQRTTQDVLEPQQRPAFFCCFGRNGDEASGADYLTNGLDGGALFNLSNGAVFTSVESYNAVTMFSDVQTAPAAQGKIIDFISIGGSGAVGHAFEPLTNAAIDNTYFAYNLFADSDMDGRADLTFVEAAFTAIPFLSWSEVVIGDPLMRISYGPGEDCAWTKLDGDVNRDGRVNISDLYITKNNLNGSLRDGASDDLMESYVDLCDVNMDLAVTISDLYYIRNHLGSIQ